MPFRELGLAEPIVRAVATQGYTTPTPIQSRAIPEILAGRDVLGCAQTGTGKTGAFALPIIDRLAATCDNDNRNTNGNRKRQRRGPHGAPGRKPRAVVLCPTRELATQIFDSFKTYGHNTPLRYTVVYGGVNQFRQVRDLVAGVDVLIATPGRLLDLMQQGHVDLSAIETLVLDEADHMLDMGFIRDIRKIMERVPTRRQTLLFSATMPTAIRKLADSILYEPVFVQAAPAATPADSITQSVYMVDRRDKPLLLEHLLRRTNMQRTLVFTRTKYGADKLVRSLHRGGIQADAIHGNKNQNARTRALQGFKNGRTCVLVATDIAARGIDVDEITHIVNFDIPNVPETYVHRIGRTARAGASGIALSFCDHEERADLRAIERLIDMKLLVQHQDADVARATRAPAPPPAEPQIERPKHAPATPRRGRRPQGRQHQASATAGAKGGGRRNGSKRSPRRSTAR